MKCLAAIPAMPTSAALAIGLLKSPPAPPLCPGTLLLPSCGPLPGVLVARAMAVCRCCRLTARPQDVAGVAVGLQGAESQGATCGGWPHDHRSRESLPPLDLVVLAASVIRAAVGRRSASILISSRVIRHQRAACTRFLSQREGAGSSYRIRIQQRGYSCSAGDRWRDGQWPFATVSRNTCWERMSHAALLLLKIMVVLGTRLAC